jgi:hypothetical protein
VYPTILVARPRIPILESSVNRASFLALPFVLLLPTACGAQADSGAAASTPPQELLNRAVQAWNSTESFRFTLGVEGRTVPLDENGMIAYDRLSGAVVAPDRLQAETVVRTPLGNTEIAFVAIGDRQWLTNPLTRQWEQAPPELQMDVGTMFDTEAGIGALLIGLENLERGPDQTLNGTRTVRLQGTLPGHVLASFAADLVAAERLDLDLWVGASDNRIRQIVVREPATNGTTPTWTFQFSNFNDAISIQPPL